MSQFINLMNDRIYAKSVIFYSFILAISILTLFLSHYEYEGKNTIVLVLQKRRKKIISYIQVIGLLISFVTLWFVSAFADCGTDRETYGLIFSNVTIQDLFSGWQEPGFILFNMFFRIFGKNPRIIYIAISTVTLLLLYLTWYKLRNDILIGYGVLAFTMMFYVQSLSLMRIYMASALLFCGVDYLRKGEYIKYAILILITTLIHYSTLLMILPYLIMIFLENKRYRKYVLNILVIILLVLFLLALVIGAPILSSIPIFARFQRYLQNVSFSNIGIMQFIYNIPICALVFIAYYLTESKREQNMLIAYTGSVFFYSLLSYGIQVMGRVNSLFSILYFFLIPMCMKKIKDYFIERGENGRIIYWILSFLVIGYYIFRFAIYIGEYWELDSVIPYRNILF